MNYKYKILTAFQTVFLFFHPVSAQTPQLDNPVLCTPVTVTKDSVIRGCQSLTLKPGFSFDTSTGKKLRLTVDPTVCSPEVLEPISVTQSENYIIACTPLDDTERLEFENGQLTVDRDTRVVTTIQYFDGLGRLSQTVEHGITPSGSDLVTLQEYDPFGRESNTWLPVITQGNGMKVSIPDLKGTAPGQSGDPVPYGKTVYEPSPLNRVTRQYGPGQAWHSGHPIATDYLTNKSESTLNCYRYIMESDSSVRDIESYKQGSLFVTKTTDEDGHEAYRFKDKQGRTIMDRSICNGENHDTYYIYDDFGNCCVILSPQASARLSREQEFNRNTPVVRQYAYFYRYDQRRRQIEKQFPGCDPVYIVYDRSDRVVLSQDGEQRKHARWSFFKYDVFGRVIIEGICTLEGATHQSLCQAYNDALIIENYDPAAAWGYTENNGIQPSAQGVTVMKVNFYDRYPSQLPTLDPSQAALLSYHSEQGYDRYTGAGDNSAKGLLTTSLSRVTGEGQMLATSFYYDYKGRIIQQRATNLLGGYDITYSRFDFSGKPLATKNIHTIKGKDPLIQYYTYTYDHAGRELACNHRIEGRSPVTLSVNTYDERGRLATRRLCNGRDDIHYTYNIRSWISSIQSSGFSQYLYYNAPGIQGSTPCFNGNISSQLWNFQGKTNQGYSYKYDGLNRLTDSKYGTDPSQALYLSYDESLTYDRNGNILTLRRKGVNRLKTSSSIEKPIELLQAVTTDNLTYEYNGNQVKKITDTATPLLYEAANDFKDGVDLDTEYAFDANGNMTADLNKGISRIVYNRLNLPEMIYFGNSYISRKYDASGTLLRQSVPLEFVIEPTSDVSQDLQTPNTLVPAPPPVVRLSNTDYIGAFIYKNKTLKKILTPVGYIEPGTDSDTYYFYQSDYQGNIRMVIDGEGQILEQNNYYPFGMLFGTCVGESNKQPYKFGGKEYITAKGYNIYDFGARGYDPSTGLWGTPDRLLEKYYSLSPYAYCFNNPVNVIDPDGRDAIYITFPDYKIHAFGKQWSNLGHAGVLLIDNKTGVTKYYEYGRYDDAQRGQVIQRKILNVVIGENGKPTYESLKNVLEEISVKAGHNGRIEGAYIESNKFKEMNDYANSKKVENNNPNRKEYSIFTNNCGTFASDVIKQDPDVKKQAPIIIDPRPNSIVKKFQDNFIPINYDPKIKEIEYE